MSQEPTVTISQQTLDVTVVVPTIGRESLVELLASLARSHGPRPERIVVVDDRRDNSQDLVVGPLPRWIIDRLLVVCSGGVGPAAARNVGWRTTDRRWVAFLDDDVVVDERWLEDLRADLAVCGEDVAATQGRIVVPRPQDRRPTDWERNVAALEGARWATADMAYRRETLRSVGGFDERFTRAYREDADLGLRVREAGWRIVRGRRSVLHPVRPTDDSVSVRLQAGNAEDPFMLVRHGIGWRMRAGVPRGRRPWHVATVVASGAALLGLMTGRRGVAHTGAVVSAGLMIDLVARRVLPGPRDLDETWRMAWTSVLLPFAATMHYLRGLLELPGRLRRPGPRSDTPVAVLFDRDGTLIQDVPYNGDPGAVVPRPGAREAIERLRAHGLALGVVSNQSGIARGLLTAAEVEAVNARVDELLGPFDVWLYCPHADGDGCSCRKPAAGLIHRASASLRIPAADCVVIGDIGSDMQAAAAAGARGILVPTPVTRGEEVRGASEVARDLADAVTRVLGPAPRRSAVSA